MKMLICGIGRIARELLRQLGDEWEISLIDKVQEDLDKALALRPDIVSAQAEDASSQVVLQRAGLADMDYVLALTGEYEVNRVTALLAHEAGVTHISALVGSPDMAKELRETGVHAMLAEKLIASHLYQYLQDPRLRMTPLNVASSTVVEIQVSEHPLLIGQKVSLLSRKNIRVVGVYRNNELVFPQLHGIIQEDDVLIILGDRDMFQTVYDIIEHGGPRFPLRWGPGMLVAVPDELERDMTPPILSEAQQLAGSLSIKAATILDGSPEVDFTEMLESWPQNERPDVLPLEGNVMDAVLAANAEGSFGMVVIPPLTTSFLQRFGKPVYTSLTHELGRPLLVSHATAPYERILVPFNASPMTELALEVAINIAHQLGAEVSAVIVEQPDFLTGDEHGSWIEKAGAELKKLSHLHKVNFNVVERHGNPVKEIGKLTGNHDLLVLGSANLERGFITPNVGEELVKDAQCSVLLLTP